MQYSTASLQGQPIPSNLTAARCYGNASLISSPFASAGGRYRPRAWSNCSASLPDSNAASIARSNDTGSSINGSLHHFIRPSVNNAKECNLWGPLCQTGDIVVGVKDGSTTASTTVPCSSYLSYQSSSAYASYFGDRTLNPEVMEYRRSFGRSSECSTEADYWANWDMLVYPRYSTLRPTTTPVTSLFSHCLSTVLSSTPGVWPAFLAANHEFVDSDYYFCCGDCSLTVDEIRLRYHPNTNAPVCTGTSLFSSVQQTRNVTYSSLKIMPVNSSANDSGYSM